MESYVTECKHCGHVRHWVGFKTGIGKTQEQLDQMRKDQTICVECGKDVRTELDHQPGDDDAAMFTASILKEIVKK